MSDHHKKRKFLNLPKYAGGSKAFREFIAANLRYPDEALAAGVEGVVLVEFDILDTGIVQHPRVLKGLGHGCDEEAMRVVSLLRYDKVKNRGLRVKMTTKTNIIFRLPGVRINYSQTQPQDQKPPESGHPGEVVYNYTIKF